MGKVTALKMDVITEKSGHTIVPNAVSVCITPAAPSPLPIPYPVVGSVMEGITDPPMRTKVEGQKFATTGSVIKTCHGNEPGTLKEVVSLNTAGPCFIIMGAPTVIAELGMMGITGALCISNKAITVGAGGTASGAGGGGGGGGGGGPGGGGGAGPSGPSGPSNGGGGGGGGNSGASSSSPSPGARGSGADAPPGSSSGPPAQHTCQNGHPVDMATGDVVDEAVDLELGGMIPVTFKRMYSSARRNDVRAHLGPGWAHSWELAVWEEGSVTVLRDAEGRSVFFEQIPVGGRSFHRGERMELRKLAEDRWEIFQLGTRLTYAFEAFEPGGQAALRHVRDLWDNRVELAYEGGRPVVIVDTARREIHLSWSGSRLTRLDVRVGGVSEQTVEYTYAESGCLVAVTDALGNSEVFEYDAQRRMTRASLKTGVLFQYEYEEGSGRCARTWGPKGLYDLVFSTEEGGRKTFADGEEPRVYTTDDQGHVIREALPSGVVLAERAYDPDGYLIAEANGAGEGTQYWYDARGNLVRRVDPEGAVFAWEYDDLGRPKSQVTPDGLPTSYAYDRRGALVRISLPDGQGFTVTHDERGRVARLDDASGPVLTCEYDRHHNRVVEVDAMGARSTYGYDALGRPTTMTDPLGGVTKRALDRLGRPTSLVFADGSTVSRQFDARGRVVREVDPSGSVTRMTYSGMGALTQLVAADGRAWAFRYNGRERLTEVKAPNGEVYGCRYDEAGRLVEERTFDGRTLTYARGPSGRVTKLSYGEGSWREFSHDRAGRFLEERGSDGSVVRVQRDKAGRISSASVERDGRVIVTSFERDAFGRIAAERHGDLAVRYAYDATGRVSERTLPGGQKTRYTYDRRGDAVRVEHAGFGVDLERDAAGQERSVTGPEGRFRLHASYDAMGRVLEQRLADPAAETTEATLLRRLYAYDRAGRLTRVTDERWGLTEYGYDAVGQLVERGGSSASPREAFSYDAAGSLVRALEGASAGPAWKLAPGGAVLETRDARIAHDKRGRRSGVRDLSTSAGPERITEYTWDVRDRLLAVKLPDGATVRYEYDAFGRRVERAVVDAGRDAPRERTRFLWSDTRLVAELEDRRARVFVHKPGTMVPLLHEEHGEVFLTVTDHLGVPRELVDASGRVAWAASHSPWGVVERSYADPLREGAGKVPSSPFRMLGQVADDHVGLCWTRFRVFDPRTRRFLSPDPLEINGGMRPFGFEGSPTTTVDPHGLGPEHEGAQPTPLDQARQARDARAEALGPERPPTRPAAVTGGFNTQTGQVVAGQSGGGRCAEDDVCAQLGGDPANVRFTEAVRPRPHAPPFNQVPVCQRCEGRYGRGAFPPGTAFASDAAPSGGGGGGGGGT